MCKKPVFSRRGSFHFYASVKLALLSYGVNFHFLKNWCRKTVDLGFKRASEFFKLLRDKPNDLHFASAEASNQPGHLPSLNKVRI